MLEVIVSILIFWFESLSVIFCLHYLYGRKLHIDVVTICFIIIDIAWMEVVHFGSLNQAFTLLIYPVIALYCGLEFGYNIKSLIINNIVCMVIITIIQATAMIFLFKVFEIVKMDARGNLFIGVITFLTTVVILKRCNLTKLSNVLQSNERLVMISVGVVVISFMLFIINFKQRMVFNLLYYAVLGVSILMIIIAAIDIGKHKIKVKEAEAELRLHKLYESSFRELIDEICARQHEFDNHINAIYSQHKLYKTYNELVEAQRKYCGEIMEENRFNKILSKGNPVILCFLYSQFCEMEKRGIYFTYQICIGELECGMPVHKMVELLGNLIKNAIEAIQKRDNGKIHIVVLEEIERIQIEVSNVSEFVEKKKIGEFFRKGYSEKGEKRGYGLYNVSKICEEYCAVINCKNENREGENWLVFKVLINKPL